MVALGVCNIFGSLVHSMPTTGSFSRTAVNSASGVKAVSKFGEQEVMSKSWGAKSE